MNLKSVYEIINKEINLNFKTKTAAATAMQKRKQDLNDLLNRLQTNKGITIQRISQTLEFFGYEIIIRKKKKTIKSPRPKEVLSLTPRY
ncbi:MULTISPECIES: hypothetical protein [Fusobacterium]|uniref:hypothetical protein n=1 Tax=Fusobacterium TaxID=848 RepID=UPI000E8404C8|nr:MULTISPECIES: hypothetical protein [Fusobacterium]HBJ80223.1 hypothetical protein [Fusobacterium sp.]